MIPLIVSIYRLSLSIALLVLLSFVGILMVPLILNVSFLFALSILIYTLMITAVRIDFCPLSFGRGFFVFSSQIDRIGPCGCGGPGDSPPELTVTSFFRFLRL